MLFDDSNFPFWGLWILSFFIGSLSVCCFLLFFAFLEVFVEDPWIFLNDLVFALTILLSICIIGFIELFVFHHIRREVRLWKERKEREKIHA